MKTGIYALVGAPGTGKSTIALRLAFILARQETKQILVMDCGAARNFAEWEGNSRASTPREVIKKVWGLKTPFVAWTPENEKEYDAILGVTLKMGNIILFIDELSFFSLQPNLRKIGRTYRHRRIDLFVTTQNVTRDLASEAQSWGPELYLFRLASGSNLDYAEHYFGLDRVEMQSLPNYTSILVSASELKPKMQKWTLDGGALKVNGEAAK